MHTSSVHVFCTLTNELLFLSSHAMPFLYYALIYCIRLLTVLYLSLFIYDLFWVAIDKRFCFYLQVSPSQSSLCPVQFFLFVTWHVLLFFSFWLNICLFSNPVFLLVSCLLRSLFVLSIRSLYTVYNAKFL